MASTSHNSPTTPPSQRRQGSITQVPHAMPSPPSFLPVTAEANVPISPRGQRLSQILQSRVAGSSTAARRSNSTTRFRGEDLERGERGVPRPAAERLRERSHSFGNSLDIETADGARDEHGDDTDSSGGAQFDGWSFEAWQSAGDATHEGPAITAERKTSVMIDPHVLDTPTMRSQRLIGNSNPRYKWEQYYKSEKELKKMKKPIREYYQRNNYLIQQYIYIDRLLDSSLPHDLIQEYYSTPPSNAAAHPHPLKPIPTYSVTSPTPPQSSRDPPQNGSLPPSFGPKVQRTKDMYRIPTDGHHSPADENTPLLPAKKHRSGSLHDGAIESPSNQSEANMEEDDPCTMGPTDAIPAFSPEEETSSSSGVVTFAIYLNLVANTVLLIMKFAVALLTSSVSVLASLVDAALDFLSTAIIWVTTHLVGRKSSSDLHTYPVGRRRLEPIGVLVFSVIMITSFFQVALEALNKLSGKDRKIIQLTPSAIGIMLATVVIKGLCWIWCRLIRNSSVQALAQDALTDVVFNSFSIVFPLAGYYLSQWYLDPLGGLLLSFYVIISWSLTTKTHILNLTGRAASADERNILLYLTMRFAHSVLRIQALTAYHVGDKLNVEVDIVMDEGISLRDSHDLAESLQYVIESVPGVERAFVHTDYFDLNLPSHMRQ